MNEFVRGNLGLVAALLLIAAGTKFWRLGRGVMGDTPLHRRFSESTADLMWVGVAVIEVALGWMLLTRPSAPWVPVAATVFFLAATVYLGWASRSAPDTGCGCLSSTVSSSQSLVGPARTVVLATMCALGVVPLPVLHKISGVSVALTTVAEIVLLAALSPELKTVRSGLASFLRDDARLPRCLGRKASEGDVQSALRSSVTWRELSPFLVAREAVDSWTEGCWRLLSFDARVVGQRCTAVFGVRIGSRSRDWTVKGALVHDEKGQTLLPRLVHA